MSTEMAPNISNIAIWDQLDHFNVRENWGEANMMDVRLLFCLDKIRHKMNKRFNVHCGYGSVGHAPNSFHRVGMAVDFDVQDVKLSQFFELYTFFSKYWYFGGIGIYPYWKNCGIHLDLGPSRTWLRDAQGVYIYDYKKMLDILINL